MTNALPAYNELPALFAIELDNLGAITLSGEEQIKYLQGQVTCDVEDLKQQKLLAGGHCNAKGKVFSVFRLIERQEKFFLIQASSSIADSLAELKKFGVFAKVDIAQDTENAYLAIAGQNAAEKIAALFQVTPDSETPVVHDNGATIIYLAGKIARYLIIDNSEKLTELVNTTAIPTFTQPVWDMMEIADGFPMLKAPYIAEYVPQMLNLQAIKGISFTKGCYLGQETVARMQYLGKNKRALFALSGADSSAKVGDIIEKKLGENWRKAGDVLAAYHADNKQCYLQAVLANDIDENTELRIKNQQQALTLMPLPYSLNTDLD
ncbi:hypothetical protein SAMN05216262_102215 [Colwellia chukchiensis]|uniref:tRNA-modifying protein YgfZ-like beta-barrel domain-containing protein n=1 Tax=Colwellia chukchiensis TaxID=641665 RepID=A0A1H7JF58_9GAMM|nr:tRNA-modifying protein YgfZ [Colwellia chukchiensis]SEK73024.1 hypothetical protein SAMN05216262_102215 [Colwellia chukchiensis]